MRTDGGVCAMMSASAVVDTVSEVVSKRTGFRMVSVGDCERWRSCSMRIWTIFIGFVDTSAELNKVYIEEGVFD